MANGIEQWWREIPLLTRYGFGAAFFTTLAANFGLISPSLLVVSFDRVFRGFEIWRLITCFPFMGRLGLPFLMNLVMFYRYSGSLESTIFQGRVADYLFMWLFGAAFLIPFGMYFGYPILSMGLIMMIVYYWSRKNPDGIITFMFGIKFQAVYLPWVLMGFTVLLGGIPILELFGVVIGHLYFYLDTMLPAINGPRLLRTPQFLYNLFPRQYNQMAVGAVNRPQVHRWGQGNALGGGH